jgi:hypothetical protein
MAEINLTQDEADLLIAMKKYKVNDERWDYPGLGGSISVPLVSENKRENFILDIYRGRIDLVKGTYQNRSRQVVILVRLDFGGQPHRNPDQQEVPSPHLHLYREGFGDKWAFPVPLDKFPSVTDLWQTVNDFMVYCNVVEQPNLNKGLFS